MPWDNIHINTKGLNHIITKPVELQWKHMNLDEKRYET